MVYNRYQRDLMIAMMTEQIANLPVKTTADREIKYTITPAIVDLASDCNELEDKLNQAHTVNETLQKVIRSVSNDKSMAGGGPG